MDVVTVRCPKCGRQSEIPLKVLEETGPAVCPIDGATKEIINPEPEADGTED